MSQTIDVKTLLGHNNLEFSLGCLSSFVENSHDKIRLIIFGDGSLTKQDKHELQTTLQDCIIVDSEEYDKRIKVLLADYPACSNYHQHVVYARKLFDMMLYDENDTIYIDSDIFFTKKFQLPAFKDVPVFMYDTQNAYSFKPNELRKINQKLYPKVNSGFFFFPRKQFDLDFVESMLKDEVIYQGFLRGISWLEQTLWSLLASRNSKMFYFDPQQAVMADYVLKTGPATVCVHLVSSFRSLYFEKVKGIANTNTDINEYQLMKLKPAQAFLKVHHFYLEKAMKRVRRVLLRRNW